MQYKVQRIDTNTMVITDSLQEARDIAHGDAKLNNTALIISEKRGTRWYKLEAIHKDYEIISNAHGYEIRERNGKRWLYLETAYNNKYTWCADYLYSKKYKTFIAALEVLKRLISKNP